MVKSRFQLTRGQDAYLQRAMARSTYSVTQAQSQLPRLLKEAERGTAIGITRRDETVAYLLSRGQLEAIVEPREPGSAQGNRGPSRRSHAIRTASGTRR